MARTVHTDNEDVPHESAKLQMRVLLPSTKQLYTHGDASDGSTVLAGWCCEIDPQVLLFQGLWQIFLALHTVAHRRSRSGSRPVAASV